MAGEDEFAAIGRREVHVEQLQRAEILDMPHSRPLPVIGPRCHELRVKDKGAQWRIVYRSDADAVVIADVFAKKSRATPQQVIETCRRRLREYDAATGE